MRAPARSNPFAVCHPPLGHRRVDGKIKKRRVANLSNWPEYLVEGLRTLLKGGVAVARAELVLSLTISRSLPYANVVAVLGMVR